MRYTYHCDHARCEVAVSFGANELAPPDWGDIKLGGLCADDEVRTAVGHLCPAHMESIAENLKVTWKTLSGREVPRPGVADRCSGRLKGCVLRNEHRGACSLTAAP